MSDGDVFEIEFPPVSPENIVRLAEDSLQVTSAFLRLDPWYSTTVEDREYLSSISDLRSGDASPPTSLSSAEAAAWVETFRQAVSVLSFPEWSHFSSGPWFRLYTHALLRESRIFPNVELCDESLDYTPFGFADIWKGNYHGEPVCVKAIRTQDPTRLKEIRSTFRRGINGRISHPNLLPIIEISETRFPFCIMSPWMPDGNITQYTQMNPDADRLILLAQVCRGLMYLHWLDILHGSITPGNILITPHGQARLADFGIMGVFRDLVYHNHKSETLRYMAPERLPADLFSPLVINGPSTASDVYSLAMTSFEVLTGISPNNDSDAVPWNVRRGERPTRPTGPHRNRWLRDDVWYTITTCWSDYPKARCALSVVYRAFSTSSPQNVKSDKPDIQQRAKFLPRITSLFQFLRDSEPEIEKLINGMDKRLEDRTTSDLERLKLLNKLCKTCSRHRVIPKSMHIPDCSKGSVEVESGGFADISQGTY